MLGILRGLLRFLVHFSLFHCYATYSYNRDVIDFASLTNLRTVEGPMNYLTKTWHELNRYPNTQLMISGTPRQQHRRTLFHHRGRLDSSELYRRRSVGQSGQLCKLFSTESSSALSGGS
jgi:hypothetical protein